MIQHIVCICHLPILVSNDWKGQLAAGYLINVLDPSAMALHSVGRETDQLDAPFCELWLEFGECTELGRAYRCVVLRVREEDNPFIPNEFMKVDGTICSIRFEVGSNRAKA